MLKWQDCQENYISPKNRRTGLKNILVKTAFPVIIVLMIAAISAWIMKLARDLVQNATNRIKKLNRILSFYQYFFLKNVSENKKSGKKTLFNPSDHFPVY